MATFKIEGLAELERALAELPKSTGKALLRRVLKKAGQPIADAAKSMAPDDPTTTGPRDLGDSIGVSTRLSKRQASIARKMFKNDKASVEMHVGAGSLPQAHLQEFGTEHHGAQPYMRPAWDGNKMGALEIIKNDLGGEIEKSAKRLAAKTARLAAKG